MGLANLYRLLARVWIQEADETLLDELRAGELNVALTAAGCSIPQASAIEELALDYCQLFIGPKNPLRPVQSVWSEGQLEGAPAASMRDVYLPLLPDFVRPHQLMPDHLGIQLAFMSDLIDADVEDLPARFFADHLAWTKPLTDTSSARAQTDFYRTFIQLTADFLTSESAIR